MLLCRTFLEVIFQKSEFGCLSVSVIVPNHWGLETLDIEEGVFLTSCETSCRLYFEIWILETSNFISIIKSSWLDLQTGNMVQGCFLKEKASLEVNFSKFEFVNVKT